PAVPWPLYLRRQPPEQGARSEGSGAVETPAAPPVEGTPAPAPVPASGPAEDARRKAREMFDRDPADLFGLALQAAAEEAEKIKQIEAALASMAQRLTLAESYKIMGRWKELAELAESVLISRPILKL